MTTTTKKQAILQSLESMSASETEQLLSFIRGLLYNPSNDYSHLCRRAHGMREIRQALRTEPQF
ncbi:hypothetical protein [Fulvivirga sedimenti]|uniref:Uncharacterized protein n=1 Tax=Fulvivirga sedimenti TaxID=2879465 RepID=A0A9X1L1P0_9BACT|nr:hypothetical protein [Fulvivirga sedimenti]MCA6078422.1 hypothetical protein [Fulvivirga sedimenti]